MAKVEELRTKIYAVKNPEQFAKDKARPDLDFRMSGVVSSSKIDQVDSVFSTRREPNDKAVYLSEVENRLIEREREFDPSEISKVKTCRYARSLTSLV